MVFVFFFICSISCCCNIVFWNHFTKQNKEILNSFAQQGFYSVRLAHEKTGYVETADYLFSKSETYGDTTIDIVIGFDFENGQCHKNQYYFDMEGKSIFYRDEYFVHESVLTSLLNVRLAYRSNLLYAEPITLLDGDWLELTPLIAHAGGGLRLGEDGYHAYQNTLEAVIQNYELGHRVFEIDFQVTSDGDLAAVHDGLVPGDDTGIEMSSKEWKAYSDRFYYTTLLIDDLLREMIVNKDMFIVTDTKWNDTYAFEIIYEHAMALDPSLLDRFIPQIYNIDMYEPLVNIYNFPSIIFTTYSTHEQNNTIIEFASQQDNIHEIMV